MNRELYIMESNSALFKVLYLERDRQTERDGSSYEDSEKLVMDLKTLFLNMLFQQVGIRISCHSDFI